MENSLENKVTKRLMTCGKLRVNIRKQKTKICEVLKAFMRPVTGMCLRK